MNSSTPLIAHTEKKEKKEKKKDRPGSEFKVAVGKVFSLSVTIRFFNVYAHPPTKA